MLSIWKMLAFYVKKWKKKKTDHKPHSIGNLHSKRVPGDAWRSKRETAKGNREMVLFFSLKVTAIHRNSLLFSMPHLKQRESDRRPQTSDHRWWNHSWCKRRFPKVRDTECRQQTPAKKSDETWRGLKYCCTFLYCAWIPCLVPRLYIPSYLGPETKSSG